MDRQKSRRQGGLLRPCKQCRQRPACFGCGSNWISLSPPPSFPHSGLEWALGKGSTLNTHTVLACKQVLCLPELWNEAGVTLLGCSDVETESQH